MNNLEVIKQIIREINSLGGKNQSHFDVENDGIVKLGLKSFDRDII